MTDTASNSLVSWASTFIFDVTGDFQLRATINLDLCASFDSGLLVGCLDGDEWFEPCAEIYPLGCKRVVTVVANGRSDDANGIHLASDDIYLRVGRIATTCALRASNDGNQWDRARYFALNEGNPSMLRVGNAVPSPASDGRRVRLSEFGRNAVA